MVRSLLAIGIGIAWLAAYAQAPAPVDLEWLLRQADARRREFTETFKGLIAVETRLTELFDRDGRVTRQRLVVSDFLVYSSSIRDGIISEYRVPRAVDGKAVRNAQDEAIKSFKRIADAKRCARRTDRRHCASPVASRIPTPPSSGSSSRRPRRSNTDRHPANSTS